MNQDGVKYLTHFILKKFKPMWYLMISDSICVEFCCPDQFLASVYIETHSDDEDVMLCVVSVFCSCRLLMLYDPWIIWKCRLQHVLMVVFAVWIGMCSTKTEFQREGFQKPDAISKWACKYGQCSFGYRWDHIRLMSTWQLHCVWMICF